MTVIDVGRGAPVVLIPGIQGRWEWMRPTVNALATRCRVITFSLADEPTAGAVFDETRGFDAYVEQVTRALDTSGLERAAICGVSYGGLVAAAFAARHPERVASLVLVSAVHPSWRPNARAAFYLRAPRLHAPLFCLASVRLYPEIAAATQGFWRGVGAALRHGARAATHPFDARRMARRVAMTMGVDWTGLEGVHVPVLVVTGDSLLDRVVPPALTREYVKTWPHARHVTLPNTGHLGLITRATAFADIVCRFVDQRDHDLSERGPASSEARPLTREHGSKPGLARPSISGPRSARG